MDKIRCGCGSIDSMLNGGFERGCITEIYGEAGSGKTNICLSTAINTSRQGYYVIYIDTEGVSMERFEQLGGDEELSKKILFYKVYKFSQQGEIIERAINLVEKRNDIALLIVDSMTEFYRAERGVEEDLSSRKRSSLAWQLSMLNSVARRKNLAVLITNQVYMDTTTREIKPIGGHTLHHNAKTIIFLKKIGNGFREAILVKHRSLPEGLVARFVIRGDGLYPVDEKE